MHELGVVIDIVKKVENIARANSLTTIDTLVLQIGELSSMIPRYVESCYPAAVDGTMLEATNLRIEILPAAARCRKCSSVFNPLKHEDCCPHCSAKEADITAGREFMIKEIIAC
ncbi:MAG: hydrogenase maturation nickel metallochaperone HypA [Spirochaetales bacterium]|nr:hydrogenase maturation nickel metallochaperone HypA [Spirochaetales bacterium]